MAPAKIEANKSVVAMSDYSAELDGLKQSMQILHDQIQNLNKTIDNYAKEMAILENHRKFEEAYDIFNQKQYLSYVTMCIDSTRMDSYVFTLASLYEKIFKEYIEISALAGYRPPTNPKTRIDHPYIIEELNKISKNCNVDIGEIVEVAENRWNVLRLIRNHFIHQNSNNAQANANNLKKIREATEKSSLISEVIFIGDSLDLNLFMDVSLFCLYSVLNKCHSVFPNSPIYYEEDFGKLLLGTYWNCKINMSPIEKE